MKLEGVRKGLIEVLLLIEGEKEDLPDDVRNGAMFLRIAMMFFAQAAVAEGYSAASGGLERDDFMDNLQKKMEKTLAKVEHRMLERLEEFSKNLTDGLDKEQPEADVKK